MAKMQLEENIGYFSFSLLMLFFFKKLILIIAHPLVATQKFILALIFFGYNIFLVK